MRCGSRPPPRLLIPLWLNLDVQARPARCWATPSLFRQLAPAQPAAAGRQHGSSSLRSPIQLRVRDQDKSGGAEARGARLKGGPHHAHHAPSVTPWELATAALGDPTTSCSISPQAGLALAPQAARPASVVTASVATAASAVRAPALRPCRQRHKRLRLAVAAQDAGGLTFRQGTWADAPLFTSAILRERHVTCRAARLPAPTEHAAPPPTLGLASQLPLDLCYLLTQDEPAGRADAQQLHSCRAGGRRGGLWPGQAAWAAAARAGAVLAYSAPGQQVGSQDPIEEGRHAYMWGTTQPRWLPSQRPPLLAGTQAQHCSACASGRCTAPLLLPAACQAACPNSERPLLPCRTRALC